MRTWRCIRTCLGHEGTVTSLSIFSDGKRIVGGDNCHNLIIWDMATGERIRSLKGHWREVTCVDVSPDGRLVVSAGADKTTRVWNVSNGQQIRTLLPKYYTSRFPLNALAISPDGKQVAVTDRNPYVWLYDLQTGRRLGRIGLVRSARSVCWSPDAMFLVVGTKQAFVINVMLGRGRRNWQGETWAVAWSSDGKFIARSFDGAIRLYGASGTFHNERKLPECTTSKHERSAREQAMNLALDAGGSRGPMKIWVNARDRHGNTPLHIACGYGRNQVVQLLLESDADPNAKNKKGTAPLQMSGKITRKIKELLRKHGAK